MTELRRLKQLREDNLYKRASAAESSSGVRDGKGPSEALGRERHR